MNVRELDAMTEPSASSRIDAPISVALTLSSGMERMFPTLTPVQVERIAAHGHVRQIRPGEVLVQPGDQIVPFFVVTAGQEWVFRASRAHETLVAVFGTRQVTGWVNILYRSPRVLSIWSSYTGG